jgi:hypothetical protein
MACTAFDAGIYGRQITDRGSARSGSLNEYRHSVRWEWSGIWISIHMMVNTNGARLHLSLAV